MLYLTQASTARVRAAIVEHPRLGQLIIPAARNAIIAGVPWAMDNGAFTDTYPGDDAFLELVTRRGDGHRSTCLFVPAPDVVGDWTATRDLSTPMLARIRAEGWPAALVVQDGIEHTDDLERLMPDLDAVFIGGSTEWKLGPHAARIVRQARARGKWAHMGRVNSRKRFRYADAIGCHSADGTFIARAPDTNLARMRGWLDDAIDGIDTQELHTLTEGSTA